MFDDEDYYYDTPDDYGGGVEVDPSFTDEDGVIWENGLPIGFDNGDGSWTDTAGNIYDENDQFLGIDNGDGSWWGADGVLYGADNTPIADPVLDGPGFDSTFEYDPATGLYFDTLTGAWFAVAPDGTPQHVSDNPAGPSFEELATAQGIATGAQLTTTPGFFSTVGSFLGKLFGGSASGGGFSSGSGGGSSGGGSSSQQAQQRQQQAQQQLNQARAQNAPQQQIAQLQQQLKLTKAAAQQARQFEIAKYFLIAAGAGAVAYVATTRRGR